MHSGVACARGRSCRRSARAGQGASQAPGDTGADHWGSASRTSVGGPRSIPRSLLGAESLGPCLESQPLATGGPVGVAASRDVLVGTTATICALCTIIDG